MQSVIRRNVQCSCMQVFFLCIYFPAYRHHFATELGFALVMPPILGMDKIPPSYPNSYSVKIKLYITDFRFWTRISDLILPSWLKLLSFFFFDEKLVPKGLPWFPSSAVIANIGAICLLVLR